MDKSKLIENLKSLKVNSISFKEDEERMLIRDFASILPNDQDIKTVSISDYKLVNIKIDSGK